MDAGNVLEAMKAELAIMREEKICMEECVAAAEIELEETKRVIEEYKDMEKLANDLLDFVLGAGGNDVQDNRQVNLDEETIKALLEETVRDFADEINKAHSRGSRPVNGGNGGGYDDGIDDQNLDGSNIDVTGGGGSSKDGNSGGRPK
ncbi:uncharacterized protein LOC110415753 [Herrania umbratica]|uniref:Uncharacterized protein LOC110415753 n=1 Tax=Herrania umbratica TaxID=108875 RepID=A0A6J1A831_9ROSI|nr:uncharacterized protein LOC110415753 [Herrania umbratica]